MTREEAINKLQYIRTHYPSKNIENIEADNALVMAIDALKQEPITVDTINQYCKEHNYVLCEKGTEPKTGNWIDTGSGQECSECGEIQYGYDNFRYFCANCGAEMKEGDA